jgi:hypothetical protein
MRPALLIEVKAIGGLIVGAVILIYLLGWPERHYAASFETIALGSTRESIVERLGKPSHISQSCYVAQFIEFENPPGWTQKPSAAYCAHWFGPGGLGIGQFYAVAFDSDNRVVGIAYGDS